MSYSFNIRAADASLALAAVELEMNKVAERDIAHKADLSAHFAATSALIALARSPREGEELSVSVSGSLGWRIAEPKPGQFESASLSINVNVLTKTG